MIPRFEWDERKAALNQAKHGVSFAEASTVFADARAITKYDEKNSITEDRYVTIGLSAWGRLILIAHTDRGDSIRIISARKPTPKEARDYIDPAR